jgi:hypothetical protein
MNQSNQDQSPPIEIHDASPNNGQKLNRENHSTITLLKDSTRKPTFHTVPQCKETRVRRPFRDAAELQVAILNAAKEPKVTPNTLSQLAKAWVSLESQKMAIRQERLALRRAGLARPSRGPKPLPNELRPTGEESSFVESLPAELAADATAAGVQTRKPPMGGNGSNPTGQAKAATNPQKVPKAIIQPEPENTPPNPPREKPKAKGIYSNQEG